MPSITLTSPGAVAFHAGVITIRWYGLMITAGFLVATWVASRLAARQKIDADNFINGALLCFIGGIIGARLYFVALSWPAFAMHPEEILQTWLGGLSIHGGIIGGALTAYIYCRRTKMSFLPCIDVAATVIPLAQAIGRWGNFFNSEAFGRAVNNSFPIKLFIPVINRPPDYRDYDYFQPTFLYESIWDLCIFFVLYFYVFARFKKYPGLTSLAYLLLYSIGRMIIEPLRTDSIMLGNLPAPLMMSALLIVGADICIVLTWQHYKRQEQSSPQEERLDQNSPS